jgi:hypothetical protein
MLRGCGKDKLVILPKADLRRQWVRCERQARPEGKLLRVYLGRDSAAAAHSAEVAGEAIGEIHHGVDGNRRRERCTKAHRWTWSAERLQAGRRAEQEARCGFSEVACDPDKISGLCAGA